MKTFQRISIEISRERVGESAFRARAVAEFTGSPPMTCEIALSADNRARVWCDSQQQPEPTLAVLEAVLAATRTLLESMGNTLPAPYF